MSVISCWSVKFILPLAFVEQMRAKGGYFGEVFLAQKMCSSMFSCGKNYYLAMWATQFSLSWCSFVFVIAGDMEAAHTDGVIDDNFVVWHRLSLEKLTLQ